MKKIKKNYSLKILIIIPARKNSKRLKNKNLLKINNKSLIQRTIEVSKKIVPTKNILVSTDSKMVLKTINNLAQSYNAYDNNQNEFFNSLITNAFNANKDFINDIVSIDSNNFYIFNVLDIKSSKPIELSIIKENVLKDWELSKKIEKVNKLFKQNETNIKFVHELSNLYSQSVNKLEIKKDYTNLPKDFINNIFESNEGGNILTTNEGFFYIANIKEIKMPNIKDIKKNNISLNSSLKSSFGNELLKNAKISTNDILINAVIDRY